jgi:hypothetical protein
VQKLTRGRPLFNPTLGAGAPPAGCERNLHPHHSLKFFGMFRRYRYDTNPLLEERSLLRELCWRRRGRAARAHASAKKCREGFARLFRRLSADRRIAFAHWHGAHGAIFVGTGCWDHATI